MDPRAVCTWFEGFDWALTPAEYAAYGVAVPSSTRVIHGFVIHPPREDLAWVRRRKGTWAWRKLAKARRWARVLSLVPFVRMIAIGNALGYGNCRDESDIDLVIITTPRRIWTVRFLVVGLLWMFRQRPGEHARLSGAAQRTGRHTRDALCPSFFLTTEAMDLRSLQLPASGRAEHVASDAPSDPYLLFWITQLAVLYDAHGTYDAFWRANALWVQQWLPTAHARAIHPRLVVRRPWRRRGVPLHERILRGRFGDAIEGWARRFQEQRFPSDVRALANRDTRVVVHDRMIKLHTNDRRTEYRERWLAALADRTV